MDLGGMVGTYVNRARIEANNPFGLNCGDLIGIGCPESSSVREEGGKETFVYKLLSPRAFLAQSVQVEADLEEDAPTPPPSPWDDRRGGCKFRWWCGQMLCLCVCRRQSCGGQQPA